MSRISALICPMVCALALVSPGSLLAGNDDAGAHSGFLGDASVYAKLESAEARKGQKVMRWHSPLMGSGAYGSILVDDVSFHPEAQPGPQVSIETLNDISAYITEQLRTKAGSVVPLAAAAGPGVLRMQVAITAVTVKTEGMKAYEVLPVAAVFGGLKAAAGKRDMDVRVSVEARYVDSGTGELVGAGMRELEGEDLKGKKARLTLDDMRKNLDQATDDAIATLASLLRDGSAQ